MNPGPRGAAKLSSTSEIAREHASQRAQSGYDAMADEYARVAPSAYQFPIERHAAAAFIEAATGREGAVVDVGCGTGHVAADMAAAGLNVVGCDPSPAMLSHARRRYPELTLVQTDAYLGELAQELVVAAIIARFSLIHLEPAAVARVLASWAERVAPGTPLLVAFQAADELGPPIPFDHAVAPAWRWHPDEFSRVLAGGGFVENWRIVYRDPSYRFPMAHVLTSRA